MGARDYDAIRTEALNSVLAVIGPMLDDLEMTEYDFERFLDVVAQKAWAAHAEILEAREEAADREAAREYAALCAMPRDI